MELLLLVAVVALLLCVLIFQILLLRKRTAPDLAPLCGRLESIERASERTDRAIREEVGRNRDEAAARERALREEVTGSVARLSALLSEQVNALGQTQRTQLESFGGRLTQHLQTVDARLDEMRRTVDEQLQGTLEKRLGQSFQLVSE